MLLTTPTALATTGALSQPAGKAGCISETGAQNCTDGHGLAGAHDVAVSPDGKNVYVAAYNNNGVAILGRNTATGALTQPAGAAGCVSQTGAGPCADGHGLKNPASVTVSPDGNSVYVASPGGDDVARLNRNTTTGALTQPGGSAGCISETGAGPCAAGHGLLNPREVAISPDGVSAYVASPLSNAVAVLDRNTATGALTQSAGTAGCVSANGSGSCAIASAPPGLASPASVAVSPDGKSVYAAAPGRNAVGRLDRNTTTGAITQPAGTAGCISIDGSGFPPVCTPAWGYTQFVPPLLNPGFNTPISVAVSPDGKSVYLPGSATSALARLERDTASGAISQPAAAAGCVSQLKAKPCAGAQGLKNPISIAVSPDGKSVYFASYGSDAVTRFNRAP